MVTPNWWGQWLRWCRDFVITGRVVCADGSPVPGAEVRAYDVDFFWWWASWLPVAPAAVTDANGHFSITFRWCCGWLPIWWWRLRQWRLDQDLLDKIRPVLALNPNLHFPEPDPAPNLAAFASIAAFNPQPDPPRPGLRLTIPSRLTTIPVPGIVRPLPLPLPPRAIDPSAIPALRDRLVSVLPKVPELERLHIWPWWPWTPWFDCSPDIIFRVTQNCGANDVKTIVDENIFDTRWDVPTTLDVTLVANQNACCLPHGNPDPDGDCALLTGVCGDPGIPITSIGGNSGAPASRRATPIRVVATDRSPRSSR